MTHEMTTTLKFVNEVLARGQIKPISYRVQFKELMWMVLCPHVDIWGHMDYGCGKLTQG